MKIVVIDENGINKGDISWQAFQALGELSVFPSLESPGCLEAAEAAECLISVEALVKKPLIERCVHLRYIGALSTGYDEVDTSYAKQRGISVTNVPVYGTASVAQYTFAMLLELCHHVALHDRAVRDGEWARQNQFSFWLQPMKELSGKTLGIIGFGRIGRAVAHIGKAFGMRVLAYDAFLAPGNDVDGVPCVTLDEVLSTADVITLHCPLTESNYRLINREAIAKMKPGVILLNAARGKLIHEEALVEALETAHIAAAALDAAPQEPLPLSSPLLRAPNLIITPHIAWATTEARQRIVTMGAENLSAFIHGNPQNIVNL